MRLSLRTLITGAALSVLTPALAVVSTTTASHADGASDLTAKFQSYGNNSSAWSGGDGSQSLQLSDGRVLWFFADSFYGDVVNGNRRPFGASFIRNSMIVQTGTSMATVMGGTDSSPSALVKPAKADEWLWPAGQMASGGYVYKFYQRFSKTEQSSIFNFLSRGVELVRMPISTITNPDTYSKVTLPGSADCQNTVSAPRCLLWGTDLLTADGFTYIYGTEVTGDGNKYLHVARVPAGDFTGTWRYWNGNNFGLNAAGSKRLMNGVQEGFSVSRVNGRYVLLTQALEGALGGDMVVYYSNSPTGFNGTNRSRLMSTPETTTDWGNWTYEYRIVEHLTSGNQITVSYNTNSQNEDGACAHENYWTASIYRPRFVTLTLPTTPTGGSDVLPTRPPVGSPWSLTRPGYCTDSAQAVPVPGNVSATALPGAEMSLRWSAPPNSPGAWNYDFQLRDVTAGQAWETMGAADNKRTGFHFAPSSHRWDLWGLHPGHAYQMRVRSTTWTGKSSAWVTVSADAYLATPTNVSVSRTNANTCTLTWNDGQPSVMWDVYERNLRTGAARVMGPFGNKSALIGYLSSSDGYEFKVRAVNSLGSSPWSAGVWC